MNRLSRLEAMLSKPEPAECARRALQHRSSRGECCAQCAKDFDASEPIYRSRTYVGPGFLGGTRTWILSFCDVCRPAERYRHGNCAICSRDVHNPCDVLYRRHIHCSERCMRAYYARLQRDQRKAARQRICEQCRSEFIGRRDSKFCTAACKQRAYRKRMAEAARHAEATGNSVSDR